MTFCRFFVGILYPLMVVCCIALVAFITPVVFAHGDEEDGNPYSATPEVEEQLSTCLSLSENRDVCYAPLCDEEPGYLCAEDLLGAAVKVAGPEKAMMALHDIMASPVFAITADGHLLSHIIGRSLSHNFGSSGENFLRCPRDFNDGCFHGFFEDTLPKVESPVEATIHICESMPSTLPAKAKSYCYHGAGHVFLMNESYLLDTAVSLCESIPERWIDDCASGVFMENAWSAREWESKKKNFRKDDPLFPCNVAKEKFKHTCYTEQYNYLMTQHDTSFHDLVAICSTAGDYVNSCLSGIGIMLQSPQWVETLVKPFAVENKSYIEKVLFLCSQFPEEYMDSCHLPVVGAFLNFDYPDVERSVSFCESIAAAGRTACFDRVWSYLGNLGNNEQNRQICSSLSAEYRDVCLRGALRLDMSGVNINQSESKQESPSLFMRAIRFFSGIFTPLFKSFAQPVHAHDDNYDEVPESGITAETVHTCLSLQEGRDTCYASICGDTAKFFCATDILQQITINKGPATGMQVLEEMVTSPLFSFSRGSTGHSLAHEVGRTNAEHFGINGAAFLRCPNSFDYGCVHGFLEVALLHAPTPAAAVNDVCESLPKKPTIGRPNCYHGSGHGVMMNASYNLEDALAICDQINDPIGCWSGVFMENASGYTSGRIMEEYPEHNTFSKDNPHAPCDTVDERHRKTCYELHILYLVHHFNYNLQDIIDTCLSAGKNEYVEGCVSGFGAHILFEDLQNSFLSDPNLDFIEKTIYLCDQFPKQYRETCYRPAISQITVSYGPKKTFEFCEKVKEEYKHMCYRTVVWRFGHLATDDEQKLSLCEMVPKSFQSECMQWFNGRGNTNQQTEEILSGENTSINDNNWFRKTFLFFAGIVKHVLHTTTSLVHADSGDDNKAVRDLNNTSPVSAGERVKTTARAFFVAVWDLIAGLFVTDDEDFSQPSLRVLAPEDDSESLLYDNAFMDEAIQTYTLRSLNASLSRLGYAKGFDCHNRAHELGRRAYELRGAEAFKGCGLECHSGCRHGATEAFFADKGTSDLIGSIKTLCSGERDRFGLHQCIHGAGHGLMAWFDYELYDALGACDLINEIHHRKSCYSGVFMENIVGGIARDDSKKDGANYHFTDYLNNDPHYPCNAVADTYKDQCYWLQTDRMSQLFGDFQLIAPACADAPEEFQHYCFHSMGRTVSGGFLLDPVKSFEICAEITNDNNRDSCLMGVLNNLLWDETHADGAIAFCALSVGISFEQPCYNQLVIQIAEVVPDTSIQEICQKLPDTYYERCVQKRAPPALPVLIKPVRDAGRINVEKTDNAIIQYMNGEYTPDTVHISVGQKVTWVNNSQEAFWPASNLHPTHTAYPGSAITKCDGTEKGSVFDACAALGPGTEYSFVFHTAGQWRFHDHINPTATGTVIVSG